MGRCSCASRRDPPSSVPPCVMASDPAFRFVIEFGECAVHASSMLNRGSPIASPPGSRPRRSRACHLTTVLAATPVRTLRCPATFESRPHRRWASQPRCQVPGPVRRAGSRCIGAPRRDKEDSSGSALVRVFSLERLPGEHGWLPIFPAPHFGRLIPASFVREPHLGHPESSTESSSSSQASVHLVHCRQRSGIGFA